MTILYPVYKIDNAYAVKPRAIAKSFHYTESYIDKLVKKKVLPGFKYKHNVYIFVPRNPIKIKVSLIKTAKRRINPVNLPTGKVLYLDWDKFIPQFPKYLNEGYTEFKFNFVSENQQLFLVVN